MHPLTRHIHINNNADLPRLTPFFIAGKRMGFLHADIAGALKTTAFVAVNDSGFHLVGDSFEARNESLRGILKRLLETKHALKERFELYAVAENFGDAPLALADRALMPALGLEATGIHCNGYVKQAGVLKLWIARRSPTSIIEPNKLDHLVAGGQPHGLTLRENLAKEAWEEAGISKALAEKAVPVGVVRYARMEGAGLRRDTLVIFDLELPENFVPQSQDGESGDFRLLSVEEVRRLMTDTDDFKFNVPLVLIDFYIRHGLIEADEPGYAELASGLRQRL